ncbi:MAG: hypothetical protein M3004_03410, partial [Bacteroidota bacterium]|nr:hypothetical protein [Bacteroidota bacterium]
FIFGITPKRFLHNSFAKHTDTKSHYPNKPYQLTTSGYNCDCDNLVAESVFLGSIHIFQFQLPQTFLYYITHNISFSSTTGILYHLRGPPVNT